MVTKPFHALDKVVHYGAFKENLSKVVDIMKSEYAETVIIRGNPGSGKRMLIEEAEKISKVKCVYVSSHFYNDDYTAMKAIATELGFKARGAHISDLMKEIKGQARSKEKLVIVLLDFEEFCRKRQSLLYNLMNLIHTDPNQVDNGLNLTVFGLTVSLDWAENIEKRVRSRLNAKCINIDFPYKNVSEFREFASELIKGFNFRKDSDETREIFKEHLDYIYYFFPGCNRSPRALKKYMNNMITPEKNLDFDGKKWKDDYQINPNNLLRERLSYLTRDQLDLMKLAVHYCYTFQEPKFTLQDLAEHYRKKEYKFIRSFDELIPEVRIILQLKLFKPAKHDQPINQEAVFFPAVIPKQLKAVVTGAPSLQSTRTDVLWKQLK